MCPRAGGLRGRPGCSITQKQRHAEVEGLSTEVTVQSGRGSQQVQNEDDQQTLQLREESRLRGVAADSACLGVQRRACTRVRIRLYHACV